MQISNPMNKLESMSIKKNNLDQYILYGLMWWEFEQDGKPTKSLVSVRSNNLVWDYNMNITQSYEYEYARSGNGGVLGSFLSGITRNVLHNFSFSNIYTSDVLVTLTILNDGKDGFMKYNIYEGLESYVVKVNVAGVKKEEISVTLEDGIIRVKSTPMKVEMEDMDAVFKSFEPIKSDCEIYLPNIESVEAKLEDGVLTLTAPKESKGVKVEIS